MKDLIERLEKCTGPDRDLDKDILFATFPRNRVAIFDGVKHISTMTGRGGEPWFLPLADRDDCPRYTGSFDDATDLLPDPTKGWWQLQQTQAPDSPLRHFGDPSIFRAWVGYWRGDEKSDGHVARHDNPIIALVTAALKARDAIEKGVR